jgi:hypothetical protein
VTFPADVPVLTDGVVTLRAHRIEDAIGVFEQCTDPVSQKWTTVPIPYSHEHARSFVTERVPAAWESGAWMFAVEADDRGTPRFCGTVGAPRSRTARTRGRGAAASWSARWSCC